MTKRADRAWPSYARVVLQVLLVVMGVAAGAWALYRLAFVVLVLVVAALFAYVIAPLVRLAERPIRVRGRPRRLSRGMAIAFVYLILAGALSAGVAFLLPSATEQVDDMIASAPHYAQSIVIWEHGWSRYYERLRIPHELRQRIDQSVHAAGESAVESGRRAAVALLGALTSLPWLILVPVLAFFLLKDIGDFRRAILAALPHRLRLRGHRLFEDMNATLAAYVRAQLLSCAAVGALCGIGFALIGMPYPVLLAVLAGVLEFIPLVGPLLLAIVAAIVGALHAPILAVWVVMFLGGLRVVQDYVIYPRLIRRGIALHPLAVIVAVLAGAELGGVVGIFLAVPAIAIASVVFRHWLEWRVGDEVDRGALDAA
jgi:predicted PurR-regulated permease PerM